MSGIQNRIVKLINSGQKDMMCLAVLIGKSLSPKYQMFLINYIKNGKWRKEKIQPYDIEKFAKFELEGWLDYNIRKRHGTKTNDRTTPGIRNDRKPRVRDNLNGSV